MIKPSSRLTLFALFCILAVTSVTGCRSMFSSDPGAGHPKLPVPASRVGMANALPPVDKRRPPPLLLSGAVVSQSTPLLPKAAISAGGSSAGAGAVKNDPPSATALPEQAILLPANAPPSGFFMPNSIFGKVSRPVGAALPVPQLTDDAVAVPAQPAKLNTPSIAVAPAVRPVVGVYVSPTTRAYFAAGGMDYLQTIIMPWEALLRQSDIDVVRIVSSDALLSARMDALVLPSAVALNAGERSQLTRFRERGGSILATWLSGVRNEQGQWLGFDFMQQVLDTGVSGTTAEDVDDNFIMPQGDSPLTHQLPAGLRIWVERLDDWYPLRLVGRNSALRIMDWSRTVRPGKSTSVMTYDERTDGVPSRVAVLGIPERLWQSVEVNDLNKILVDTLSWLMRRPDAYLATWPQARPAALMLAIDAPDPLLATDLGFFAMAEAFGGKATYFLLSEHLEKTAAGILAKLRQGRHEISLMGDRFNGFKEETPDKQAARLSLMLNEVNASGIPVSANPGFHAPMESYDQSTHQVLAERGFAYHVTDSGVSENQLPTILKTAAKRELLLYPRSLPAIDSMVDAGLSPEVAAQQFAHVLRTHLDLGGLNIVPVAQRSVIAPLQWQHMLSSVFDGARHPWLASGQEVAAWWRERGRVSAWLDSSVSPALLKVEIQGEGQLQQPVSVFLSQPSSARGFRLLQDNADEKAFDPSLHAVDRWRQSISLQGAQPGIYHWYLLPAAGASPAGNIR